MPVKLQLIDVWKSFSGNSVCRGVDLTVGMGELVCLIGASGSGKSTILRCINLLEPVDDGQILLDGEDITAPELDPRAIHQRVGLVFQSFNLFPHMTALENVLLAPRRVLRKPVAQVREEAEALFRRFGLADRMKHYPDQLSGGQQQRVAIIRALAMKPEVMLLDEITSALDPELVGEVLDVVRRLKAEGMTIVLATHEMAFARDAADRVCFLDQGRVVEEGAPEHMFTAPREARTRAFLQRFLA
jgi:polar amino acid transport system ATP-binding protein